MYLDLIQENVKDCESLISKEDLHDKNILITGVTGIVGLNLAMAFLNCRNNADFKIYGIYSSKLPVYLGNLKNYINLVQGDLTDDKILNQIPMVDYVIHAATYGQPGVYMEDKVNTLKLNTKVTLNLFEKLRAGGKFLYFSSSSVYIGLEKNIFKESDIGISNTDHPRACYIEGKRCGEAICNSYRELGIDAKSIRLNLAYGPGTKVGDKRVLYNFIEKAIKHNKIEMLDSGDLPRTYCYISDVIEMSLNIFLRGKDAIYNVGGLSDTTIMELANLVGNKFDVPVVVPKVSSKSDQSIGAPKNDKLDITKYLNEFGTKKFVSLEKGIDKTIKWQKLIYGA